MFDFYYLLSFFIGACLGSFGNVIIYRWPQGLSIVRPRSACPQCKNQLKWFHNIPILSWLFLLGKCNFCKTKISATYPLVEFIVGLFFVYNYFRFGQSIETIEYNLFVFALVIASVIDIKHFLLPDILTLTGIIIGLAGAAINPLESRSFISSFLGVVLGGGFLWLIAYLYEVIKKKEGMGGGDIKLIAWIGAVLGLKSIPFVILVSSLVGTFYGLLQILLSKNKTLQNMIPFGPFLALAALLYLYFGRSLSDWYLSLFIPQIMTN